MCSHIPFIFIAVYYHILSLHILHIYVCDTYTHIYMIHMCVCIYMRYITFFSLYWSISVISSLWLFKQYYCDGSCSCLLALMSKTFSSVCITRNGMLCLRIQVSSALLSKPNFFQHGISINTPISKVPNNLCQLLKMLLWCGVCNNNSFWF